MQIKWENTKECQTFVLKDIFPEYELKDVNEIKNILQKMRKVQKNVVSTSVHKSYKRLNCKTPNEE